MTTPTIAAPSSSASEEQTMTSPARFAHLRALDGLRGCAVLAVVVFHFQPDIAPGGFLGVDLFFVLSGFLITSLLVSEYDSSGRISLARFWVRRARRLLPALLLVLAVVMVYTLLTASRVDAQHVSVDGVWSLFYAANWHFISSGQTYIQGFLLQPASPLRHMWSLAIEEQFYLVWPLVVLAVTVVVGGRRGPAPNTRRFRGALLAVCLSLGALSLIRMVTMQSRGIDLNRIYYGTDSRIFIILFGATLGVLTVGRPELPRRFRIPAVLLGSAAAIALIVVIASATVSDTWLYRGGYALVGALMVAVLVGAAQPGVNPLARVLATKPLVGLGLISYGVYLWHWPISLWITTDDIPNDVARFVVLSALTLAASLASYFFLEMPIRRGRIFSGRPKLGGAVALTAVTAVVILVVVPALALPSVFAVPTAVPKNADFTGVEGGYERSPRCDDAKANAAPLRPAPVLIQLIGNSVAGEVRDCLAGIFAPRNATFETVNPPTFLICHEVPAIKDQVRDPKTRPDAAILFLFVAYDDRCGADWHASIDTLIDAYKAAGTHVFLVPSVPFVPGSPKFDDLGAGPLIEAEYYHQRADADPKHITYVDAGVFLRDANGVYQWRMPCVTRNEPGCDASGTVGVRYLDGYHFCTDPDFAAHGCIGTEHQAGERRAAAAIADAVIPVLSASTPKAEARAP
jgi:peptidoglycan/LPS O-acetylase OafA/YrhL